MAKNNLLLQAVEILESYKDGEDIYGRSREFLQKYYDSLQRKPQLIAQPRNPYITKLFEKAKKLMDGAA